jgi:Ricin-type beta-trefoil lectin domain-like
VHSNKVLDVYGGSKDNCAKIIQWPYHGGMNQLWKIIYDKQRNNYYFKAAHSGKAFDLYGGKTGNCVNLIQYDFHGGNNQRFNIEYL